jgi:Na+/H+ antiporter NhaD/arsenite permease-like protein
MIAEFLGRISGGNIGIMIGILLWISAIASAFVDNIPFAATMVPVIRSMAATQGVGLDTLAWTLAVGTDVGGSATPSARRRISWGPRVAAKEGHLISWGSTVICGAISAGSGMSSYISSSVPYDRKTG